MLIHSFFKTDHIRLIIVLINWKTVIKQFKNRSLNTFLLYFDLYTKMQFLLFDREGYRRLSWSCFKEIVNHDRFLHFKIVILQRYQISHFFNVLKQHGCDFFEHQKANFLNTYKKREALCILNA